MVGQAREGLNAHDVGRAGENQLRHFSREEPPFAVLVADGEEGLRQLRHLLNGHGRLKTAALFQRVQGGLANQADGIHAELRRGGACPARA